MPQAICAASMAMVPEPQVGSCSAPPVSGVPRQPAAASIAAARVSFSGASPLSSRQPRLKRDSPDVSFRMVDFARRNAERAGVVDAIQFNGGDALERPAPDLPDGLPGTLMINPPYGERIEVAGKAARPSAEDRDTPDDFFPRLSAHWKRAYTKHPAGWTAWVLSPDMKLAGSMRLKESRRVPMWNGPIECRLYRFDLVAGSNRSAQGQDAASRGPSQK